MVRLTPRAEILNRKAAAGDLAGSCRGKSCKSYGDSGGALAAGAGKFFRGSPEGGAGGGGGRFCLTGLQMLGITVDIVDCRGSPSGSVTLYDGDLEGNAQFGKLGQETPDATHAIIGALAIRIGFAGILYCNYNTKPPKPYSN